MCQDSTDQSAYTDLMTEEKFDDDLYKYLCDNHCHPHDAVDKLNEIAKLRTGHLTLMGVREQDWDTVKKVVDQSSIDNEDDIEKCIPSFDLIQHLPTPSSDWLRTLRANLEQYPHAIVGEIGFDRSARLLPAGAEHWHGVRPTEVRCTPEHQLEVVSSQFELARDLNRSVSLHCVQAHGMVLDLLLRKANEWRKKDMKTPFRICLHSYGGSPGILPSLFDIKRPVKVYMSFSVAINGRLGNKLLQLIEKVPDDRLLIESDYNTPTGIDDAMVDITKVVAKAKKWSIQQVVEITRRNWLEFINISAPDSEHRA
ncbi:hypothetical protein BC943DRAFT_342107 [Umbelopsis sp. AD052]|nr:hypothetical protein BC943DRAFT_342107 [Umbelopsis sp. AD052]